MNGKEGKKPNDKWEHEKNGAKKNCEVWFNVKTFAASETFFNIWTQFHKRKVDNGLCFFATWLMQISSLNVSEKESQQKKSLKC